MRRFEGSSKAMLAVAITAALLAFGLALPASGKAAAQQDVKAIHKRLAQEVRHELLLLPYYGVFDNLMYEVQGVDTVVLFGEVTRPTLKSDAESVIRRLEGVGKVVDKIEVLPLSPSDDKIRIAVYHAIYSKPGLDRYALRAVPPIHIIVKNGNVTLVGVVANEGDKNLAGIAAQGVPGSFSVTNNLQLEKF
jgi:hyperosmotically inducible protein